MYSSTIEEIVRAVDGRLDLNCHPTLPSWRFFVLLLAASYALIVSVLFPYLRRRLNKTVDKLNNSLQVKIRPLQRSKRQILIDQLMFGREVFAIIEEQSRRDNISRDVLQQKVKRYAREIVPSFNACIYSQINPEYKLLISYYANSIEHWWNE